jgi:hypothetical protein
MVNMLSELASTYWKTYISYLKSKRGDRNWIRANLHWLKKVACFGRRALSNLNGEALYPFFEAVRENTELRKLLASECMKVVLQHRLSTS